MALAGVSTLGVKFGYGIETTTGTKPTTFNQLTRISAIGSISLETENIDASTLEDLVTRYVAGRQDSGGTWTVTVNLTDDTIKEWEDLITASDAAYKESKSTWFQIESPYLDKAFFVTAQVPLKIPVPEFGSNEVLTVEMTLTINEVKGMDDKVSMGN